MADTITAEPLQARKAELPGVPVVTYVNSTAAVKAESDICCTSANAVQVVNSLHPDQVLMVPDRNLALYTAQRTTKEIFLWEGCCNVHDALTRDEVPGLPGGPSPAPLHRPSRVPPRSPGSGRGYPQHQPACCPYVRESSTREFIIGTEKGILHTLRTENPAKVFYSPSPHLVCPDMKRITLTDVINALKDNRHQITVPEDIQRPALLAVERMLAVPRD